MRAFFFLVTWMACAALLACSGDDGAGGSKLTGVSAGTGSDGKVHPAEDHMLISEAEACKLVSDAISKRATELQCLPFTAPSCPQLLQSTYMKQCMQYDHGTAVGCADYFSKVQSCMQLDDKMCVLVAHPETAPNGC
jgi:hypothetical protein